MTTTVLYGAQSDWSWCKERPLVAGVAEDCAFVAGLPEERSKCWTSDTSGSGCELDPAGKRGTQAYTRTGQNFVAGNYHAGPDEPAVWQGGKNCEPPESGEEVELAYSVDNGTTW
jgi:hypothetical protein